MVIDVLPGRSITLHTPHGPTVFTVGSPAVYSAFRLLTGPITRITSKTVTVESDDGPLRMRLEDFAEHNRYPPL